MSLWSRPGDDGLTASDRLIRDLKREGLPDAEIATRVGVSVPEVKQRLERLVETPSTPAPKPPKRSADRERGRPVAASTPGAIELGRFGQRIARHAKLLIGAAIVLALAAFVAGYYLRGGEKDELGIIKVTPGAVEATFAFAPTDVAATEPGITVTGRATATVPAERAFVWTGPGRWSPTAGDRAALANRLRSLGIQEDALQIASPGQFGGGTIVAVAVPVDSIAVLGPQVEDALREIMFTSGQQTPGEFGAAFAVADCVAVLAPVRAAAVEKAFRSAESLADAAGASLGSLVSLQEAAGGLYYGQNSPCPEFPTDFVTFGGAMAGYDSQPEVIVSIEVTATFALTGRDAPPRSITAGGTASVTAEADVAYLAVHTISASSGLTRDQSWDEMIAGLNSLGIMEEDVSLSAPAYGNATVAVRLDPNAVQERATAILPLLRSFARVIQSEGVVYARQDCAGLISAAQQAAVENATERAKALAANMNGKLGGVVKVALISAEANQCPASAAEGEIVPLSSPPEVTVVATLAVTFAVEPSD